MEAVLRGCLPLALCSAAVLAQQPDEPEPPAFEGDAFAKMERDDKLIDLQWRRDANGNLEYALPGAKDAKWRRVFGKRLEEVVGSAGLMGYVAPLLHRGDLLSLTDGEVHLRRLGIATDTKALAAFARAALGEKAHRIDELDRLVAVDVLAARGDGPAKEALARLAADPEARAEVRARAAATGPRRERMTADDLLLPERADLYVTIDHARLPDAHTVLEYGRFTGLVASAMVMRMLKRPLLDDVAVGQAESDAALELPFELVRWVGMLRFDHTCVSLSWPREIGGETTWTATSVGSFSPSRIASSVRGLQVEGFESALADKRATAKWTGGSASVTSRVATGCAVGVDVAPREALAKQLLRDGVHSVRLFAPEGSKLIPLLRASGFANTIACEMEVTWGDPMLTVEKLTMKDEAAASAMAGKVALLFERVLEQYGLGDHIEKIAPTEVTVASNVVTCVRKVPQAVLQSFFADWRTKTLANARTRRLPR